jgi:hypothetical protein
VKGGKTMINHNIRCLSLSVAQLNCRCIFEVNNSSHVGTPVSGELTDAVVQHQIHEFRHYFASIETPVRVNWGSAAARSILKILCECARVYTGTCTVHEVWLLLWLRK